eukprot:s1773_g19.t1
MAGSKNEFLGGRSVAVTCRPPLTSTACSAETLQRWSWDVGKEGTTCQPFRGTSVASKFSDTPQRLGWSVNSRLVHPASALSSWSFVPVSLSLRKRNSKVGGLRAEQVNVEFRPAIAQLAGGDYDGDDVAVTMNAPLIKFLRETLDSLDKLPLQEASEVKDLVDGQDEEPFSDEVFHHEARRVVLQTGVSHLRFIFTPLATLAKRSLPQEYVNLLRNLVKDGMAKEKKDSFILAAGDQVAESIASVSKGQLRRMDLLSTSAREKIEHRNVLCAHYLNKEPGLERILRALALHRTKASNGLALPSQCFDKPLWDV